MMRVSLIAVLCLSASAAFGQTSLATITGTVTDATGAAVAAAAVEVHNLENGAVFKAASSDTGNYSVSQLPVGDYEIAVTVPGFKKYSHTKFHLDAGQTMREDIALQVGEATEAVTVTAESSLLQTESSELVHNVTLSQLDNLPLLSVGATNDGVRDYFASSRLLPGIQYTDSGPLGSAVTTTVINGTPNNSVQARLDGATMNPTSPRLLGATMETQPSTEAIQEVAILTSNFAPEFGTAGGAIVNMITKSGTNELHGTGYDYIVNEALNAAQPYTGIRNKLRQHDYGFTVGGPVYLPKIYNGKNKTFFFFSFEQFRQKLINNTLPDTVPTAAYRAGDFSNLIATENRLVKTSSGVYQDPLLRNIPSGTIFDPQSARVVNGQLVSDPFNNNQIPLNRFDPVSSKILGMIPQPLGPNAGSAGANYLAPFDESRVSNIPSIKIDQNVGDKVHMAFYFQRTNTSTPRTITAADDLPNNITGSAISANAARTFRFNIDHTATPRLLIHYTLGWNDSDFLLQSQNYPFNALQTLGIPGQTAARTFPIINTNGLTAANVAIPQPANTAEGGLSTIGGSFDQHFFERRPFLGSSVSYVIGSHSVKIGGEIRQQKFPNYNYSFSAGQYFTAGGPTVSTCTTQPSLVGQTISDGFAGFGLASFLLGCESQATINAPIAAMTENYESALYLQDSWKVTRKMTLDYGLRWDYGTYQREQFGRYASFSPNVPNPSASNHLGGQIFEATCNCNFAHNYPYAIGPRLGVAYQLNSKTVVRGGFGIVYGANSVQSGSTTNSASSTTPAFGQTVGLLQNGIPAGVSIQWPTLAANAGQAPGAVVAPPTLLDPNAGRPMRLLQWNVTVQREIGRNIAVEAAYVANRGVWEEENANPTAAAPLAALNAVSQQTLAHYGFTDFTSAAQSALLTTPISRLSAVQQQQLANMGFHLPYANFPTNQTVRQALAPFPQYTGLLGSTGAPVGKSWYDSLQAKLTKRFSHGLVVNANYTYSKNLALISTPDPFNRNLGKNLSPFDLPSQFRLTAQYEVPRIHSSLPILSNKVVAYALSGWGTGWALSYQSAPLVGLPTSSGTVPISNFLGYGPGPAQLVPGMNPWSVDWTDLNGVHHTDPLDINCHCFDPTKTVVLNPAAWTNVPNGQFAANQGSIRDFRSFRVPIENANFSRDFRIKERYSLNLRVEFTNIFNRLQLPTSLALPAGINLGNFATAPTTFQSGPNKGLLSGGFGTILSPLTGSVTGQRAGTIVARFQF